MASTKTVDLFGEDEGHRGLLSVICINKIHPTWKQMRYYQSEEIRF